MGAQIGHSGLFVAEQTCKSVLANVLCIHALLLVGEFIVDCAGHPKEGKIQKP